MKLWTQYGLGVVVWRTHAFTHTSSWHIPHPFSLCMIQSVTGEFIVLVESIFLGGDLLSSSPFITSSRITTQIVQPDEPYSISDLAMATHLKQIIFQPCSPSFHCFPRLKIPSFIQPRGAFSQAHWGHAWVQSGFIKTFTFIPSLSTSLGASLLSQPCQHADKSASWHPPCGFSQNLLTTAFPLSDFPSGDSILSPCCEFSLTTLRLCH